MSLLTAGRFLITNLTGICCIAAIGGATIGFDISSMPGILGIQAY
ncbi:hypothetical protein TGAMA5MH_02984 [Trichoderma gamsii]|uniref:Uncharacterized protein n=1 Tax=Trichoderma gamsii TaxID=398673 RepID=A0A2K0TIA1_9HYPO|nr:hypothetical protein TGAMA5MH_02984 [Trichoderma gamsii]